MGHAKNRRIHVKPLPVERILANNPSATAAGAKPDGIAMVQPPVRRRLETRNDDFDTLHPHEQVRAFVSFLTAVRRRYEDNQRVQKEAEDMTQDLLHYVELSGNMNAAAGFDMYRRLARVRRTRRNCKSENDLLQPVYDLLMSCSILDQLTQVQGKCRTTMETVSRRCYQVKTGILEE